MWCCTVFASGGRCAESAPLHVGRHVPYDPVSPGEGSPILPVSDLYRVCRQRAVTRSVNLVWTLIAT